MKKVFIIHGFGGKPNGAWRAWLMAELEKQDVYACALAMPTPQAPICSEWVEEITRHIQEEDEVYLVGHSLGATAVLRYVESSKQSVAGIILVSGPVQKTQNTKIGNFLGEEFDFKTIQSKVKKVIIIHGTNDPVVPVINAEISSKELGGELILVENGLHLNGSSGFHVLPECLQALNKMFVN